MNDVIRVRKAEVYYNTKRLTLKQIQSETGCTHIINGWLFDNRKSSKTYFEPCNWLIVDGKTVSCDKYRDYGFACNSDGAPVMSTDRDCKYFLTGTPLLKDGKALERWVDHDVARASERTAVGWLSDGRVVLWVDKTSLKIPELRNKMVELGCVDALMLDGGGSTQGRFPKSNLYSSRLVATAILLWEDDSVDENNDPQGGNIMSNSSLAKYKNISPNRTSPRNHAIDTVSIHCVVGQFTAREILSMKHFTVYDPKNGSSCNYAVGRDGSIGIGVEEKDRSWCTSNRDNDHRAITIEVASDSKSPYAVTNAAYKALITLLVDICQRNKIKELKWKGDKNLIGQVDKQNMTVHRWFANKDCPGEYLYQRHGQIAAEVNSYLKPVTNLATMYRQDDFIRHIQEAFGAKVDGIAGPETLSKTLTLSSKLNREHAAVKFVQLRLKALGYIEVGTADGIAGPKFTSAVAHFQLDNNCTTDGEITARGRTWKKLLGMI